MRRRLIILSIAALGISPAALAAEQFDLVCQSKVAIVAHGNVATAGGCLASQYLATWMIARGASMRDAEEAMHYVAPVGEKALYVNQAVAVVSPFIRREAAFAAQWPQRSAACGNALNWRTIR